MARRVSPSLMAASLRASTLVDFTSSWSGAPSPSFGDVRALAFDLDCTLIDIIRLKRHACEAAAWTLADAGLDLDPAATTHRLLATAFDVGIDRHDVVDLFLHRIGQGDALLIELAAAAYARAEAEQARPYPRVLRTLHQLQRRGYSFALITDAPSDRVRSRLAAARLHPFFGPVITGDDTPQGKGDARPFELACELLGVAPHELLMVGDHPVRDIGSAHAFGARTALARYGLQRRFTSINAGHQADVELSWFDDLLAHLPAATA